MRRRSPWLAFMMAAAITCCLACEQGGASAWLAQVEAAQAAAAKEIENGNLPGARSALERAVTTPVPHSIRMEDARVVRQDLYYRLAMVELDARRADAAIRWATTGLELGAKTDVFTTNLYIVRAEAQRAKGRAVLASRDYHEALKISESLLDVALGGDTP